MQSIIAIFSIFLFSSTMINADAEQEQELILVGEQVIDHLNKWCADAWCAGDFQHTFFEFAYQSDTKRWVLDFQTFPHEEMESVPEPLEGNFISQPFVVLHSVCVFPAINPWDMVQLSRRANHLPGISTTMSDILMNCVVKSEQKARAFFGV